MTRVAHQTTSVVGGLRTTGKRITLTIGAGLSALIAELRQLNDVAANESSHAERVRAVKLLLARRGEGPRRCC